MHGATIKKICHCSYTGKVEFMDGAESYSSQTKNSADHRDNMDITRYEKTNGCPTPDLKA